MQVRAGKVLPINKECLNLLEKCKEIVSDEGCIQKFINKYDHIGMGLNAEDISAILNILQKIYIWNKSKKPSSHLFRAVAEITLSDIEDDFFEKIRLIGSF